MKNFLSDVRQVAEACFLALIVMVMIGLVTNPVYHQPYTYPSSEKLESQGFKKLPGESTEEHETRGHSVIDFARSIPG